MSRLLPPAKTLLLSPFPMFSPPAPHLLLHLPRIHIRTSAGRGGASENAAASGTTARDRRLVKVREERRRREYDREHTYPGWAKYALSSLSLTHSLTVYWPAVLFVSSVSFLVVSVLAFHSCRNSCGSLLFLNVVIW